MSIVKMSKVSLAGLMTERDRIIARVMKLGLVELVSYDSRIDDERFSKIIRADSENDKASEYELEMERTDAAIKQLERCAPEKKPMFYSGKKMRVDEYKMAIFDLEKTRATVKRILEIEQDMVSLQNEENALRAVSDSLEPWSAMPLNLETCETASSALIFGALPAAANLDGVYEALENSAPESFVVLINNVHDLQYMILVAHKSCAEAAQQALKPFGFARTRFKDISGTAEENIEKITFTLSELSAKRSILERQINQLAVHKTKMQALYDYIEIRAQRCRAVEKVGRSDSVFYLEGWLPSKSVSDFLAKMYMEADCFIEVREAEKGEEHPILLENPKIIKPFEIITSMYSLPSTRDVDPNLLLAPFYFMFYGLMLADFGYGFLLSLAVGIVLLKFKPDGMAGQMMKMLFIAGFSTMLWGAMFGGYLGDLPQKLAGWVTGADYSDKFYGIWFNPISDPLKLLIFSLIFGLLHLFAGMAIKMYTLIRDGHVFEAIFDIGSWYVLIIGLALLLLDIFPGSYMAVTGAAMLVLTQGRKAKNPVMKLLNGVLSLYGITGYLSDVLSYSRLLALGLAGGIIASVINTLATLGPPSVVSVILFPLIIAFGTIFNIAINALGAFVHSSRLQYVEFFSKFYSGGGVAFKPFRIKTKYIKII